MNARFWTTLAIVGLALGSARGADSYGLLEKYASTASALNDDAAPGAAAADCQGYCCTDATDGTCLGVRLDYLMWWGRGQNLPPLVTTSPAGTLRAEAGVLGLPSTQVLFGDEPVGQDLRNGGRITLDYLLPGACDRRLVGRFYALEDGRDTFVGTPGANDILARPFFNVQAGVQDSLLISFPGVASSGNLFAQTRSDFLGTDLFLQQRVCDDGCYTLDWLAGYQFARLDDSLAIRSSATSIDPAGAVPVGTVLDVFDHFRTQNEFHGASVGLVGVQRSGCWRLEWLVKIALGNVHQTSIIEGSTTATEPNTAPVTTSGGLLTQPTNIGALERDRLAFIPEVNFNLGYQVNDCWSLLFGYSFLYLSDAAVAGGQVDPVLNLSQVGGPLVGPARPAPALHGTDYWLQGLSFGAEYRF